MAEVNTDWQGRIEARLKTLYGEEAGAATSPRLWALIEEWRGPLAAAFGHSAGDPEHSQPHRRRFDEKDVVLIAYGDHLRRRNEKPLATLAAWCRTHLGDCVSTVHVLPFHPSTSYEGYAITDYTAVDPALGSWEDLADLNRDYDLMMDLVLNHCSASHPWFLQFLAGEEPGQRYFTTMPDPQEPWLQQVFRARNSPVLHPFETATGTKHVWTTFSPDLIDLNWREPDVCLEFLRIIFDSVVRGARMIRLDAFVYVWKEVETSCVNRPQNHELLRLFQDALAAAGAAEVALLPSITNVSQAENYAYLGGEGSPREADLVYHLPLSALLLASLYRNDASVLRRWLAELPSAPPGCAYLNLAATHDGIGLTWLEDLMPEAEIDGLIERALSHGALLSKRKRTADAEDRPWELNTTYFHACSAEPEEPPAHHVDRFLATQSVVLALRGVPALYLPLFLAATNDFERVKRDHEDRNINRGQDNRGINRQRFDVEAWEAVMSDESSPQAAVLRRLRGLARSRRASPAFHPQGYQQILDVGAPALLAFTRTAPAGGERVLCITNFAGEPVAVSGPDTLRRAGLTAHRVRDLISGESLDLSTLLELAPYRTVWLRGE